MVLARGSLRRVPPMEALVGLLIDSQQDFNELLREYNARGYVTVAFHHHNGLIPNVTLFRWILILTVQMLTFAFVAYYVGPSFVFRRRS